MRGIEDLKGSPPRTITPMSPKTVDYLDEDIITIPGQRFVLLSFVGPEEPKADSIFAIKIRGAFDSLEAADRHAKRLMEADGSVHIFTGETGKWLQMPPPIEEIEDQTYSDERLNELMKGYKESRLKAKIYHEQRKQEIMEKGLDALLTEEERLPPPTKEEATPSQVLADLEGPEPETAE